MAKQQKPALPEEFKPQNTLFGEPIKEMDEEEIEEVEEMSEFDIFLDVGEKLVKSGDRVTYTVKRNGDFIRGSLPHPCSWDDIQKKFGGGNFHVICRSANAKGYVRSQSRNIVALDEEKEESSPAASGGSSPAELMLLMQTMKKEEREESRAREERLERERKEEQERSERERKEELERKEREAKERMEESKSSTNMMMTMMMKMMETQSTNTATLIASLMGNKKDEVKTEKIIEMMDARMEKMLDRMSSKDKKNDLDPLRLIELQSDAEDRGYSRAMEVQRQAEKKAEELADARGGGDKEEPSTSKMLIQAVMPAVEALMAARGGMGAAPQAPGPLKAPTNPHQRALPPPAAPKKPQNAAQALQINRPSVKLKGEPVPMTQKQRIEEVTIGEIGKDLSKNMLTGQFKPEATADICLKILLPFGITSESLCKQYSLDDMISIAKAKGLPDAIRPYLEKFHAHITTQAAVGSRPTPKGDEPNNP